MLRLALVLTAAAFVTFSADASAMGRDQAELAAAPRIPVFYHRMMCRLLGLRVRSIGARSTRDRC